MEMKKNSWICICLLLVGCGHYGNATDFLNVKEQTVPDPAIAKLAEAANTSSKNMLALAEIQQSVTPPPPTFQPANPAAYGMANLVSIDWAGPVEPLVKQIAGASGYRVEVLGTEPAVPIMVYVSVRNQQLGNVLRDVGFQVSHRASIVVFPNTKVIELRYDRV